MYIIDMQSMFARKQTKLLQRIINEKALFRNTNVLISISVLNTTHEMTGLVKKLSLKTDLVKKLSLN